MNTQHKETEHTRALQMKVNRKHEEVASRDTEYLDLHIRGQIRNGIVCSMQRSVEVAKNAVACGSSLFRYFEREAYAKPPW